MRCILERRREIRVEVEDEVRQKLSRLKLPKTKTAKLVLVYDGEIDPEIQEDGFFDSVISADRLLGRS